MTCHIVFRLLTAYVYPNKHMQQGFMFYFLNSLIETSFQAKD